MYRLLRAHGESTERRRRQRTTGPREARAHGQATQPVWSMDITKLRSGQGLLLRPLRHHRHLQPLRWWVGWWHLVIGRAGNDFIHDAVLTQGGGSRHLTIPPTGDPPCARGPFSALLSAWRHQSHSRPHVSNTKPLQRGPPSKTPQVRRRSRAVRIHRGRPTFVRPSSITNNHCIATRASPDTPRRPCTTARPPRSDTSASTR